MTAPRPPRLSRWFLEWAGRRLGVPDLACDARDLWAERSAQQGPRAARRWYRRQTRAACARAVFERRARVTKRRSLRGGLLDVKLGLRMLRRYPGLTLVGGLSMAFAIFVGAGLFEFISQTLPGRDLPLPAGDRIVGLRYWDRSTSTPAPSTAEERRTWTNAFRSIEHVGGFRTVARNLAVADGVWPVEIAEMSPVGFTMAGIPPLAGRVLADADAVGGAPPVLVMGERLWRGRFGGDPAVVGRAVRVGDHVVTVVGVMPESFGFPINHELWMPLRSADDGGVRAFGRLASGASLEQAQAEFDALTRRAALERPLRYQHLTAQVLSYRESLFDRPLSLLLRVLILQLNAFAALFLMLVAANVALLMFARTASRERELAVRTALGASRSRIVTQLFVEALVLALVAAGVGLAATGPGLSWLAQQIVAMGGGRPPFWFRASASPATIVYAGALTILAATLAGVLPALKATGRQMKARFNQAPAAAAGLRFGGIWTAVVVVQIAATVVFTAGALLMARQARRAGSVDVRFPAADYLTMQVDVDRASAGAPIDVLARAFARLLSESPSVAGVTMADRLPLMVHPSHAVEVDGDAVAGVVNAPGFMVSTAAVDTGFFDVFRAPVLAGRAFDAGDANALEPPVVIDAFFVEAVFGGRNAVGRRLRFVDDGRVDGPGPWHRIVGIVGDLETDRPGSAHLFEPPRPVVYRPLEAGAVAGGVRLAVLVRGSPETLAATVYRTAASVSQDLRISEVQTLDRVASGEVAFWRLWADLISLLSAVALVLSLAGTYAVTSFTVSRRTREIGVRIALGGQAPRVVAEIFRGPFIQVCTGVVAGSVAVVVLVWMATGATSLMLADGLRLLALGAGIVVVTAIACLGPTRRALRVQPVKALSSGD